MAPILELRELSVSYETQGGARAVLSKLSLDVSAGEALGIVGESGSGKTVLVRSILGLLDPPFRTDHGTVVFEGRDLRQLDEQSFRQLRGGSIALTTPEPRKHLNPLISIGRQIVNVLRAHQTLAEQAARTRTIELLRAVGIPDPERRLAAYPHELSGGMCQRVIIAMALAHQTKLLLVDEPTAGLDVTISRQILDLMHELAVSHGTALMLVSRDLGVVAHYCRRVAVMYDGRIVEDAPVEAFFAGPAHPYSRQLLRAAAASRGKRGAEKRVDALAEPARTGCPFRPRCPVAVAACATAVPALQQVAAGRRARCLRAEALLRQELAA
ncbi:MAG: ABC transporter ATP-binding protein [Alphaproteobacteria bacterium]|nr:ABC transporter ATP-binding protein [Alphaproteobacteria bacterium]